MSEDLKIMQKIFDMMEYGYQTLAQYPKSEKFALVTDIKHSMDILPGYDVVFGNGDPL